MKKTIVCLIAAAALFSSCSKDEHSSEPALSDKLSSTAITMLPVSASLETKAAIDGTTFPTDRTILLSACYKPASGTSANYFSGVTFAKHETGSYWYASSTKYWPFSGTLDFFGVSYDGLEISSPSYCANVSEGITLDVPDNSSVQCDILHGSVQNQAKSESSVAMSFKHAEALLCFVAKSEKAYDAANNLGITIEKIAVENAYFSGTVAIATTAAGESYCTWSNLGSQKAGASGVIGGVRLLKSADPAPTETLDYDVPGEYMDHTAAGNHMGIGGIGIIVPEQTQTRVCIQYTQHNGKSGATNIDNTGLLYSFNLTGSWEEGKKYIYQIYFKPKEITIAPTVVDWTYTTVEHQI